MKKVWKEGRESSKGYTTRTDVEAYKMHQAAEFSSAHITLPTSHLLIYITLNNGILTHIRIKLRRLI